LDEFALVTLATVLLVSGLAGRVKSPTVFGGFTLVSYLAMLVIGLAYHPKVAMGVYLAIGGGLLFAAGLLLSIYRDRLLAVPEEFARKEGVFEVLTWR